MRILMFMAHPGHARNFESTLRLLCERGHAVHIAVDRAAKKRLPGTAKLLESLVDAYPQLTWGTVPKRKDADYATVGLGYRASLDYLRFADPAFVQPDKIRQRAARPVPVLAKWTASGRTRSPRALKLMRSVLRTAERAVPVSPEIVDFVRDQQPDAVLVTPLVELGSPQVEYLRAARAAGVPTGLLVASWDNLTMKGLIHEVPELVAVWNDVQRREAAELHGVPPERVAVTGAVAYDHWFTWQPGEGREEFCTRVGLDPAQPYVLYVGSSDFIAPDEASFVREWARAVGERGGLQVLVRPHPTNPLPEEELATAGVAVYPRTPTNPTDKATRGDYFESIYFSAAVVGVNTSAFLESAIVGRPVHALLAERFDETQRGIQHFNYLVEANGGMLRTAETLDEHVAHLSAAVSDNGRLPDLNARFVASFVRPRGLDEPAARHLVAAIEALEGREPEPIEPLGPVRRTLGRAMVAGGRVLVRRRRRQEAR